MLDHVLYIRALCLAAVDLARGTSVQQASLEGMGCRLYDGRKMRQERCEAPAFSMVVEVVDHDQYVLHTDVAASVDAILAGKPQKSELRSSTSKVAVLPSAISHVCI